ncbi:hypothetical protein [Thalassobellus citreus]|uniref:hypothetical protein n=1 Tax=Thalassobellus citreus TaxID=3367752 RepID=UPI00379AEF6F
MHNGFYYIKTKDAEELCQEIINYFHKSDNDSFGNKHFWGTKEFYTKLLDVVLSFKEV